MNILMLTSVYPQPDDESDFTATVKYIVEAWKDLGHDVIVIHNCACFPKIYYLCPSKIKNKLVSKIGFNLPSLSSRNELEYSEESLRVCRFPIKKVIPHGKFKQRELDNQFDKIVKKLKDVNFTPDIILSHWVNPQLYLLAKLKNKYGIRTSFVFHNDCTEKNIKKFKILRNLKYIDAIGCRNDVYANYVKETLKLDKKPFVCNSGISKELILIQHGYFKTNNKTLGNNTYIFVGRLVKYKNVDVIIQSLYNSYPNRNFTLDLVGDGPEYENLLRMVKELHLEKNVKFHGMLKRSEAFKLMLSDEVFIMVSDKETFGMVYIEAMLAGCVTVASTNGGVDGIIINGENGFLSKEGDITELTNTINFIKTLDKKQISEIRLKSLNTALKYSDEQISRKYLNDAINW